MMMNRIMMVWLVGMAVLAASTVYAQETPKAPTCQEQLTDVTVQAYNLDVDRDAKERLLAKSQAQVYGLQNQVAQLQKQVAAMQKALAPKAEEQGK